MIPVQEALQIILSNVSRLETEMLPLDKALGAISATDIHSPIHMPPFNQSAMDGYAIAEGNGEHYLVIGEIQAGFDASEVILQPGQAVRIFTGAMVPESATAVIKQEVTTRDQNNLRIHEAIINGSNIRLAGEQIQQSELALPAGTKLTVGAIGFLAMLGITEIVVFRKPKVHLLVTGDELVAAGTPLRPGQIYESNTTTLKMAFQQFGIQVTCSTVKDNYEETRTHIQSLLSEYDLLITSGGISVGDYDFVGKALTEIGVEEKFYKVKQKPGKPLYFGQFHNTSIFALPGNPAAALTCFYIYIVPALYSMLGDTQLSLQVRQCVLEHDYTKTAALTHFLKGWMHDDRVSILGHQSSAMLHSFTTANALIRLDEGREEWKAGDTVSVYILP